MVQWDLCLQMVLEDPVALLVPVLQDFLVILQDLQDPHLLPYPCLQLVRSHQLLR
jgi:hypothetical protein